jgi:hypothetical protein
MKNTLALFRRGFHSSSGKTPEFVSFARTFKKEFTNELSAKGCTLEEFSVGHFYVSGFFKTSSGQLYFFSISDVRFFREERILYRTATSTKDYTGGTNRYTALESDLTLNLK